MEKTCAKLAFSLLRKWNLLNSSVIRDGGDGGDGGGSYSSSSSGDDEVAASFFCSPSVIIQKRSYKSVW